MNKKEPWEAIATVGFSGAVVLLCLLGAVVKLISGVSVFIVLCDLVIPVAFAYGLYRLNRTFDFLKILLESLSSLKSLSLFVSVGLIAIGLTCTKPVFMRFHFPIIAAFALSLMLYIFRKTSLELVIGLVSIAAPIFALVVCSGGGGLGGMVLILMTAFFLIAATPKTAGLFADSEMALFKVMVVEFTLIIGSIVIFTRPQVLTAMLHGSYNAITKEACFGIKENVLYIILHEFGKVGLFLPLMLMGVATICGMFLVSANTTYSRFLSASALTILCSHFFGYILSFLVGFSSLCPFLDTKVASIDTLFWTISFLILPPSHIPPLGDKFDFCRPVYDLDDFIVEQMELPELVHSLKTHHYMQKAWNRLISEEFQLNDAQELWIVESLPLNRAAAILLRDYVYSTHSTRYDIWQRLLIYFSEFFSDAELVEIQEQASAVFSKAENISNLLNERIYQERHNRVQKECDL